VDDRELKFGYLLEDGVMCHTLNCALGEIKIVFGSPDLQA
jgi:hypothetical protein